jgi:hypothetical protein
MPIARTWKPSDAALLPVRVARRRGSLHYMRCGSRAEVAELLGDLMRVAADHYVYALGRVPALVLPARMVRGCLP